MSQAGGVVLQQRIKSGLINWARELEAPLDSGKRNSQARRQRPPVAEAQRAVAFLGLAGSAPPTYEQEGMRLTLQVSVG